VDKRYNPVIAAFYDRLLHIAFGMLKSWQPLNSNHALA
jgi:hypothetical protein